MIARRLFGVRSASAIFGAWTSLRAVPMKFVRHLTERFFPCEQPSVLVAILEFDATVLTTLILIGCVTHITELGLSFPLGAQVSGPPLSARVPVSRPCQCRRVAAPRTWRAKTKVSVAGKRIARQGKEHWHLFVHEFHLVVVMLATLSIRTTFGHMFCVAFSGARVRVGCNRRMLGGFNRLRVLFGGILLGYRSCCCVRLRALDPAALLSVGERIQ